MIFELGPKKTLNSNQLVGPYLSDYSNFINKLSAKLKNKTQKI
jgi:hypothetical protein